MPKVTSHDLESAIDAALEDLTGIDSLYPGQHALLSSLMEHENIIFTSSTNSGKTLPAVIYPRILKNLVQTGYSFPSNPKVLFLTALNSIKLSLVTNVKAMGINCEAVTIDNLKILLDSDTSVLFISPEVFKTPAVSRTLLTYRSSIVLKVVDEAHLGKYYAMTNNFT